MEWFGGSVDGKYLVMSGAADDSVDWTFGWNGRLQYVAVLQRGDDADNGIEADNNEFNNEVLPRSNPQIYNITLCGDPTGIASEVQRAANLRRGTAFTIRNFLYTGFRVGFQIADNSTLAQVNNGTSQMGSGAAWGNLSNIHSSVQTFMTSGRFPNIVAGQDAGLAASACNASITNPNLQPALATLAGGQMTPALPPNDGFFDVTTYIGAVAPAPQPNWMAGWTSFPQN
jgi:hypothetical protein